MSSLLAAWPLHVFLPLWALVDPPGSLRQALTGAAVVCAAHALLLQLAPRLLPLASQAVEQAAEQVGALASKRAATEEGNDGVR